VQPRGLGAAALASGALLPTCVAPAGQEGRGGGGGRRASGDGEAEFLLPVVVARSRAEVLGEEMATKRCQEEELDRDSLFRCVMKHAVYRTCDV
jgi:hypothetical protein